MNYWLLIGWINVSLLTLTVLMAGDTREPPAWRRPRRA